MADERATTSAKSELWCVEKSPQAPLGAADSRSSRRLSCNPLNQWSVLDYLSITYFYDAAGCLNEQALAEGKHRCQTRCALLCLSVPLASPPLTR